MKLLTSLLMLTFLFSCQTEEKPKTNTEELATLRSKVEQLQLDSQLKDSIVNESLSFFNEIQDNLVSIGIKEEEVRSKSMNPELRADEKQLVLESIKQINFLREENAKKIGKMQDQMKSSGLKIKELDNMISRLMNDVALKDEQIAKLQIIIGQKDADYDKLFDAYLQKEFQVELISDEMHTAFYTYGTAEELEKNGIIDRTNGFIGIGKKAKLKQDFNANYFTEIDTRSKKEFLISGSNVQLISTHPTASYSLVPNGTNTKLVVKNTSEFWKVTRYLIVVVK